MPDSLQMKLATARRWWRFVQLLAGLTTAFTIFVLLVLACFYTDRLLALTTPGRIAWLTALLGGTGLALLLFLRPLLRALPEETVAVAVERRYPALEERLLTTVELARAGAASGVSGAVVAQLGREIERVAAPLDFARAVPLSTARRPVVFASVAAALLLGHVLIAPGPMGVWLRRILNPSADIPIYARTQVWVTPGDSVVPRGEDVTLGVKTSGRIVDRAKLHYRLEGGAWTSVDLQNPRIVGTSSGEYRKFPFGLSDLQQSVTFYASAGDGRANPHTVRVEDRPTILSVRVSLTYPAYTGRRPESFTATAGSIVAPVGTRAEIVATANKRLRRVEYVERGRPGSPWTVEGDTARGTLTVTRDQTWGLRLRCTSGFDAQDPPEYTIHAQPDTAPQVQVQRPGADVERTPFGSVALRVTARDDYGVRSLHLAYRGGKRSGSFGLPFGSGSTPKAAGSAALWNLGALGLKAGDTVVYEARARDGDNVSGPHTGRSASYRIRIVGAQEMRERLDSQAQQEVDALKQLLQRQKEAQRALAEAQRDPSKRAQAEGAERAAAQEATELARRMRQTSEQMRDNNLAVPGELERRDTTRQALEDLGRRDMPRASDMVRANRLADAARQEQSIREALERMVQQNIPAPTASEMAQSAEKLAQEQQQLADRSALSAAQQDERAPTDADRAELAAQAQAQASLQQRTQALQQQLQQAAQQARERGQPEADALQQAAQQLQQSGATRQQQAARQDLKTGRPGEASPRQNEAAQALRDLTDRLDRAVGPQDPKAVERRADRLEQLADRLTQLANQQAGLARDTQNSPNAERSRQMAAQEQGFQRQAQQMASQLEDAPGAQQETGRAAELMQETSGRLNQNRAEEATPPAREATRRLMQAAMDAQETARQLRRQQEAMEAEQAVRQLAREQRALRQETQKLEAARRGREMTPEQQKQASDLAQKQGQLSQQSQRLTQEMPSEPFRWGLREAARRMDQAASGLWQRNAGPDTQRRQENAAQTLERVARALGRHAQGAEQAAREGGQQSDAQQQMAESQGALQLAREMEAQIRQETAALDRQRDRNPNRNLTAEQQRDLDGLREGQRQTRDITRRAANDLRSAPAVQKNVESAAEEMEDVQDLLSERQTGRPTQQQQGRIVQMLDRAIRESQQAMRQQRQQQAMQRQQRSPGQSQSQRRERGDMPAQRTTAPVVQAQPGAFGKVDPRGRGFGGLSPRAMQSLREGQQERVPAEYRDLVNQYYKALSERGR